MMATLLVGTIASMKSSGCCGQKGLLTQGSISLQAPFGTRAQQQALRQQLSQQAPLSGQSSWDPPTWGGSLGTTPTRSSGGMTLGAALPGYPTSGHGLASGQSQTSARSTRRRSGGVPAAPSSRTASLQGGALRQQLQSQFTGSGSMHDDQGGMADSAGLTRQSGSQELAARLSHAQLSLYDSVPEHMQWPQPQLPETPAQPGLPHRSGTAASTPQTNMLSPESHSSVPNPADWDPLYR